MTSETTTPKERAVKIILGIVCVCLLMAAGFMLGLHFKPEQPRFSMRSAVENNGGFYLLNEGTGEMWFGVGRNSHPINSHGDSTNLMLESITGAPIKAIALAKEARNLNDQWGNESEIRTKLSSCNGIKSIEGWKSKEEKDGNVSVTFSWMREDNSRGILRFLVDTGTGICVSKFSKNALPCEFGGDPFLDIAEPAVGGDSRKGSRVGDEFDHPPQSATPPTR